MRKTRGYIAKTRQEVKDFKAFLFNKLKLDLETEARLEVSAYYNNDYYISYECTEEEFDTILMNF